MRKTVNHTIYGRKAGVIRLLMVGAGCVSVGLGILGIFLPLLPTTPFMLLAAALFARSSDRFYTWLLNNRLFGVMIRNYREGRGIPLQVKITAIVVLWATILSSAFLAVSIVWVRAVLFAIAAAVTYHILSRPTYVRCVQNETREQQELE